MSALTAILADYADVPLYLVVLYAAGAFCLASFSVAAIFHALLQANEWHHRTTAEGKLEYIAPLLSIDVDWSPQGKARHIRKMNLGVQFRNSARFPIEYKMTEFNASLEGRVANADRLLAGTVSVVGGSITSTQPNPVDINNLAKPDVSGRIQFKLKYGRPGDLRYEISKSVEFDAVLHPETSVKPNPNIGIAVRDRV